MRRRGGSLARAARPRVAGLHRRARLLAADLRRAPVRGGGAPPPPRGASAARWPSSTSLCASRASRAASEARANSRFCAHASYEFGREGTYSSSTSALSVPHAAAEAEAAAEGGTAASPDDGCSPGATGSLAIASGVAASFAPASLAWRARRAAACA